MEQGGKSTKKQKVMTKEVEDIIKRKTYAELTSVEREAVAELVEDEDDYNQMKWFLVGTTAAFNESKIQASSQLKKGVMDHLTESKKEKGFWLNSVGVFLMPSNKKVYQKPAFQMGIAAAVIVGFLFFFNNGMDEEKLALNTPIVDQVDQRTQETAPKVFMDSNNAEDFIPADEEEMVENRSAIIPPPPNVELKTEEMNDDFFVTDMVANEPFVVEDKEVLFEAEENSQSEVETGSGYASANAGSVERKEAPVVTYAETLDMEDAKMDRARDKKFKSVGENSAAEKPAPSADKSLKDADQNVVSPGNLFSVDLDVATEKILPKAFHINQTKELNALFYIAK